MAFYANINFDDREVRILRNRLRNLPEDFARIFGRAALKAAEIIEREIENTVPYDINRRANAPGRHLRDAIASYSRDYFIFGKTIRNASAVVGVWERHAVFVEYGAPGNRQPNPFFRRALASTRQRVNDTLVREVRRDLRSLSRP